MLDHFIICIFMCFLPAPPKIICMSGINLLDNQSSLRCYHKTFSCPINLVVLQQNKVQHKKHSVYLSFHLITFRRVTFVLFKPRQT